MAWVPRPQLLNNHKLGFYFYHKTLFCYENETSELLHYIWLQKYLVVYIYSLPTLNNMMVIVRTISG